MDGGRERETALTGSTENNSSPSPSPTHSLNGRRRPAPFSPGGGGGTSRLSPAPPPGPAPSFPPTLPVLKLLCELLHVWRAEFCQLQYFSPYQYRRDDRAGGCRIRCLFSVRGFALIFVFCFSFRCYRILLYFVSPV